MEETSHNIELSCSDEPPISKETSSCTGSSDVSNSPNINSESDSAGTFPFRDSNECRKASHDRHLSQSYGLNHGLSQRSCTLNFHPLQKSQTSNKEDTLQSKNRSHSIYLSHRDASQDRHMNNNGDSALTSCMPNIRGEPQIREIFRNRKKSPQRCTSKGSTLLGRELNVLISSRDFKLLGNFQDQWNSLAMKCLYLMNLCLIGIQNYYSSSCQNLILKRSIFKSDLRHLAAFNRNLFVYTIPASQKDIQLTGRNYQNYSERLQTFTRWPASHSVSAIILARNGFVYAGGNQPGDDDDDDDDEAICPSCFENKSGWLLEDDPQEVHIPTCPFLLNSRVEGTYLDSFQSNTPLMSNHFGRGSNNPNIRSIRAPVHHRALQPDNYSAPQHRQLQRWRPSQPFNRSVQHYWPFIFQLPCNRHVTTWIWTPDIFLFRSTHSVERFVSAIPRWVISSLDLSPTSHQTSVQYYQFCVVDFNTIGTISHNAINLMEGGFFHCVQNFWHGCRIVVAVFNIWALGLFHYSAWGYHSLRVRRCLSYASLAMQLSRSPPRSFPTLFQISSSIEMIRNNPRQHFTSSLSGSRIRHPLLRKILFLRCDGVVFQMTSYS